MSKRKKQYYVVVHGHQPGIYDSWFGEDGASDQVEGFPEAIYKGFYTREEALDWLRSLGQDALSRHAPDLLDSVYQGAPQRVSTDILSDPNPDNVFIYTDGGALNNPGPGGYGVVLRHKARFKELSGGFRLTTNNRMELLACIKGLQALKKECSVTIHSDSKYVVESMTQGWARRWQANGWKRSGNATAENVDLWQQLLDLCNRYAVEFQWIRGHSGHKENERCHQLATEAMQRLDLPIDVGYETKDLSGITSS